MDPIYISHSALYFYVQPLRRHRQTVLELLCNGLTRVSCEKILMKHLLRWWIYHNHPKYFEGDLSFICAHSSFSFLLYWKWVMAEMGERSLWRAGLLRTGGLNKWRVEGQGAQGGEVHKQAVKDGTANCIWTLKSILKLKSLTFAPCTSK